MRYCIICGKLIENEAMNCPYCGASQETEFPSYGAGAMQIPPEVESQGTLQPQFGAPLYTQPPVMLAEEEEMISGKKGRLLISLLVLVGLLLMVSVYFTVLVLTRNHFLDESEDLKAAIPAFEYTINGENYGEMSVYQMTRLQSDGLFTFDATYRVNLADERLKQTLNLEVHGENVFPFGWKVTDVHWSDESMGIVEVNITGMKDLVQAAVEEGIPTHRAENFAIWVNDQNPSGFKGDLVISNLRGSNYSIQGSYSYEGEISPSTQFDRGIHDYAMTIRRREAAVSAVSYSGNKERLTACVYVRQLQDGEVRLRITDISGSGIHVEAVRTYTDGRKPLWGESDVNLLWSVNADPKTGNPLASDRIGCTWTFTDARLGFQIIIGPETIDVIGDDNQRLEPRADYPFYPVGPDGVPILPTKEG